MATADVETVNTAADKAKLGAAVALVLAALVAYYLLGQKGALIQWAALLVCLVGGVVVFLSSLQGRRLIGFGRDAWREVQKVVWPTRKESMQMTAYVFGFVVIMALFLWSGDNLIEWVIFSLVLGWK